MADHLTRRPILTGALLALLCSAGAWRLAACQGSKSTEAKCKENATATACKGKGAASAGPATGSDGGATAPPAAAAFPFPVEDSKGPRDAVSSPSGVPASGSALPAMPTDDVPDPPASSERPLRLPPGYGGSSSSNGDEATGGATGTSSSRSPDDDDIAPTTAAPDAPIRSSALKDLGSRGDTSEARAKLEKTRVVDDLRVGSFYMKDGNAQGAYLRFKDAADHAPDDPDVRFNLAEAAGRLNKRDEAVLNYQEYLRLDAGGDHDKVSRKALGRLGAAAR